MAFQDPRPAPPTPLIQQNAPAIRTIASRQPASNITVSADWTTVKKVADEVRASSAVLANDAQLIASLLAGNRYMMRLRVWFDTTAAGDFQWALTGPALTSIRVARKCIVPGTTALANIGVDTAGYTTAQALTGTGTTGGYVEVDARVHPSAAGTFAFQWAQNTSDAGNTVVLAGSYLQYSVV